MELKGFARKFRKGEVFDPLKDSKLNGDPVFPDNLSPERPKCELCGSDMLFLMQLTAVHNPSNNRILFVYYCLKDATKDKGWKLYRYSCAKNADQVNFGEMNQLSSWVDGLNLSTTIDSDEFQSNSSRIILEKDFVQYDHDIHSMVLLEKYKNKPKEEIDEEDLVDFELVKGSYQVNGSELNEDVMLDDSPLLEDEEESFDEDDSDDVLGIDKDEEVEAINKFHNYMSTRKNVLFRLNKGGKPISFIPNFNYNSCCKSCNSPLNFELQLLPNIVKYLTDSNNQSNDPTDNGQLLPSTSLSSQSSLSSNKSTLLKTISMTLGGVSFYTCSSDCLTGSKLVLEASQVMLYK